MEVIAYPSPSDWPAIATRPAVERQELTGLVREVFSEVAGRGDDAVREYSLRFDKVAPQSFRVSDTELEEWADSVPEELKSAIRLAASQIESFHQAQRDRSEVVETIPGVRCWRESRPMESVGIYIPGGTAPLFSTVLMLAIPARLAGCREIVLCTPPDRSGKIHPAIAFCAREWGVTSVCRVGGIQAVAAMTFGTSSVPRVHKLFGPGNQYVTAAKEFAQTLGVAIDMPAGPSEVLVIADEQANPEWIAADLLSQAEHGPDSQVMLVTTSRELVAGTIASMDCMKKRLPRQEMVDGALRHSRAVLLNTLDECIAFSNVYGPEHLLLACGQAGELAAGVRHAGSVFIGPWSCESAGDYASGTNHVLPTNGHAVRYSGVSLDSFVKKITFQELSREGLQALGPAIVRMATEEKLDAHALAVTVRMEK